mgnify:CR=1 FL=1
MGIVPRAYALRSLIKRYKWQIACLTLLGFLGAFLEGVGVNSIIPLLSFIFGDSNQVDFISKAVKFLFEALSIPFTFRYLLVFIGLMFIFRSFALFGFVYVRARIGADYLHKETYSLTKSLLNAKWSYLLTQKTGYIQNTLIRDVQRGGSAMDVIGQFIQSLTGLLMYLIIALNISPVVTLSVMGAGAVMLFVFKPLVKKTQRVSQQTVATEKDIAQHVNESIIGIKTIKVFTAEGSALKKVSDLLHKYNHLFIKNVLVRTLGTIFIQPFSFIFILVVFAFVYKLPGFSLAAFAATLYLIQKIFIYLESCQGALHSIGELDPYLSNISGFHEKLEKEVERDHSSPAVFSSGVFTKELALKNVQFSYGGTAHILKDISIAIPKGKTVACIGPSGSGKTTIADLLLGLFSPDKGRLTIDGHDMSASDLAAWRQQVGYVSQDMFLTNDTIRKNIEFFGSELSDDELVDIAKRAHVYDFVKKMPSQFDTVVGERGVMLSAGQRQRIALARALARKPSMLILDEATSALDTESEQVIQETINALKSEMTVFVIAHRLSTVVLADYAYVIDKGVVIEEGKPSDLINDPATYFHRNYHGQHKL